MSKFLSAILLLLTVTSSNAQEHSNLQEHANSPSQIEGAFVHMVFFWLKPGVDAADFISNTKDFVEAIDVVKSYHLGQPAMTPREVVDNSYSVSLVVTFDSKADQDTYQVHQAHIDYVEQHKSKWAKVQVYDSLAPN